MRSSKPGRILAAGLTVAALASATEVPAQAPVYVDGYGFRVRNPQGFSHDSAPGGALLLDLRRNDMVVPVVFRGPRGAHIVVGWYALDRPIEETCESFANAMDPPGTVESLETHLGPGCRARRELEGDTRRMDTFAFFGRGSSRTYPDFTPFAWCAAQTRQFGDACAQVIASFAHARADTTVTEQPNGIRDHALFDNPIERLTCPAPQYPPLLQEHNVEGQVVLEFVVEKDGTVDFGTIAVVSSTSRGFEEPAKEMTAGCRFRPATINTRPVRVLVTFPVIFALRR